MEKASPSNNWHYNAELRLNADYLRKNMTKAEACLWKYVLRAGGLGGYTFRRQRPVLHYIADFMCQPLLLVIEVDGVTHDLNSVQVRDERKDKDLKSAGFTILRFSDWEVLHHIDDVAAHIRSCMECLEKEMAVCSGR